jgi:D-methionine transport system permease protein
MATNLDLYITAIRETLLIVVASSIISYIIGLPLGVILAITSKNGISPKPVINQILGVIINIFRSIPFLILLILVLPVTKMLVGTTIGPIAVIPPLVFSAAPYIARMVESSIMEVDYGVIEAARSMGASDFQIITKVLLTEARPNLMVGVAITTTTILGYSAMAGVVGGGGLGDVAIRYGYYRYENVIMFITVIILVVLVQVIQESFLAISRKIDKRAK